MNCPRCGYVIVKAKSESSAENGTGWQRPHFRKVRHFLALNLFAGLVDNENLFKVKLGDGTTYNPDYFHPPSKCYIEVATSLPNISEQRSKWRRAMRLIKLRVFWWEGDELTDKLGTIRGRRWKPEWPRTGKNYPAEGREREGG